MASIVRDPNGKKRLLIVTPDGRKTIHLGKCPLKVAQSFKLRIEALASARMLNIPLDNDLAGWVAALSNEMHDRLAALGLVAPREAVVVPTLGKWLDQYIESRKDTKMTTRTIYHRTRRHLLRFFGSDRPIDRITPGDADSWRLYLLGEGLAENTVRRTSGIARQFFHAAVRRKLIAENPFAELKTAVQGNRSRDYYLSRDDAQKVLEACPDTQWRLIVALCRYAGLRCPSEIVGLTWNDVDWDSGKMLVHSPKTAHHSNGASRYVPIFPQLVPHLQDAFEKAEDGATFIITRYRQRNCNLRTTFEKIIRRAGLSPWPKLFQNLRASCETDLAGEWPEHVVCAWLGHTRAIAMKHYLQVTDEHFRLASTGVAQNAAQSGAVRGCNAGQVTPKQGSENAVFPLVTADCGNLNHSPQGDKGLEPVTSRM